MPVSNDDTNTIVIFSGYGSGSFALLTTFSTGYNTLTCHSVLVNLITIQYRMLSLQCLLQIILELFQRFADITLDFYLLHRIFIFLNDQ